MKKIITWLLLLTLVVGLFAGCKPAEVTETTAPQDAETTAPISGADIEGINAALDYLKSFYKDDGAETPVDFERFGIVRIGGVPFEVVWTADVSEDLIKIVVNDDGTVTIDINEECEEDTPYVLTATITDAEGNSVSHSWNYILPKAVDMIAIVEAAYALAPGESLPYESTLRGKITQIKTPWSADYQNITVVIEIEGIEDKPIECYRLKGEGAEDLAVGDIITVTGTLKNYNGTIEFDAGCVLMAVVVGERVQAPDDMKQIVDEAYALGANKTLPYEATLTGTIVKIGSPYDEYFGNVTVSIEVEGREGYPIVCYRMKGDGVDRIGVNDVITVKGYITNYVGSAGYSTIEFTAGCQLVSWEDHPDPVAPSDMKQIVDEAYALPANGSLKYEAVLKGTITQVNQAYDPAYGNITVTMVVEGREGKPIKCYRMKGNGVEVLDIGDIITVKGYITNYQHTSGDTEVEYTAGCQLIDYVKNSAVAPSDPVQIVEEAYALAPNAQLPYRATLTGKITKVNTEYDPAYGNVTVTIVVKGAEDKPIKCYRLKGDGVDQIGEGDTITVTGYIVNYQHSSGDTEVEFTSGCQMTSWSDTGSGGGEPSNPGTDVTNPEYIKNPEAGKAYKMGMYTGKAVLLFNGQTESPTVTYRLATTQNTAEAADVYLEAVSGGYHLYFMNGKVKTYIHVYEREDGDPGFGKGSIELLTTPPAGYFTFDKNAYTLVYTAADNENAYYMGTYNTFTTVSVSNTYYITGDNASKIDVSQFPVRLYPSDVTVEQPEEKPTEPTEPAPTLPEDMIQQVNKPKVGTAYKLAMNKSGTMLFFNGQTESETVTYRLATTTDPSEAVDVFVEKNGSGYALYYMNGKTKTYIKVYERQDGDAGYGKGSIELVSKKPAEVLTMDKNGTFVYTADDGENAYYMGTYSTYTTFSVSNTYYITGGNAGNVDVSQFLARLYQVDEDYVPETTKPTKPTEPATQPTTKPTKPTEPTTNADGKVEVVQKVENPAVGKAYKLYVEQANTGKTLYFDGNVANADWYMSMTEDLSKAVDVYLEKNGSGYALYFKNGKTKTYLRIYERQDGDAGYGKGSQELTTTKPAEVLTFNKTVDTLIYKADADNSYYTGCYGTFETLSVSNTSYITGNNAANVDISQFPARLGKIVEVTPEETTKPTTKPTEPTQPTTKPTQPTQPSTAPSEPSLKAYKLYMDKDGTRLYFNGQTESETVNYRLATTTNKAEAVDVFLESAPNGGLYLYYMNGNTQTYIRVYERTDGNPGYGKGSIELVTAAPAEELTIDDVTGTLIYTADDGENAYYMGTYSTFTTFSVSNTFYITGDNAGNVDVSQFPARLEESESAEPPVTQPTEPPVTDPVDPQVQAYKLYMDKNGTKLYFNGQTESASVTYRLATTTNAAEAVDVFVEEAGDGLHLYFMNGGVKTYIRVYERTDGTAGMGKGSLELVTSAPNELLTVDDVTGTLIYTADADNSYYMGTYSTFVTFSVSNTSYITGDNAANVDVSQFPARLEESTGSVVPPVTEPTEPPVTQPTEPPVTNPGEEGTVELDFTDKANRTSYSTQQQVWQQNGITVTNDKASSTTNVGDYANPGRFYKNSQVTIDYPGMTQIVIDSVTYNDNDYAGTWVDSIVAAGDSNVTATVSEGDVTIVFAEPVDSFTVQLTAGQARAYKMTVTSGSVSGGEPQPTEPPVTVPSEPDPTEPPVTNPSAGGTVEIDFTDKANRTSYSTQQQVWQQNGITVTNDKASSTTNVGDYANPGRFYKNSQVTIDYPGMTQIVIDSVTYNDNDYAGTWVDSIVAAGDSNVTATVSEGDVTIVFAEPVDSFTVQLTAGQARAYKMTVTSGSVSGGEPQPTEPPVTEPPVTQPTEPPATNPSAGGTVEISFADVANRTTYTSQQQVWQQNGITVTNDKASSSTNIGDYADPARFYKGSQVTIAYPGMTKIVVDAAITSSKDYATPWVDSIAAAGSDNVTATISGEEVTIIFAQPVDSFTVEMSAGQARADKMTITSGSASGSEPQPTEPPVTVPSEPQPTEPPVTAPVVSADKAYKLYMDKNGTKLYFNGQTESESVNYRLATTTNVEEAVDVYLEEVSGGYLLYFTGTTKTYIRVYERTDGNAGYGKGSLEFVTSAPAEVLTVDAATGTLVYTADADNSYYMGTYSTFVTFSVSNTSYITGNNAGNVDVSQFPARLEEVGGNEAPTEPEATEPEATEPEATEPIAPDGALDFTQVSEITDGYYVIAALHNGKYYLLSTEIASKIAATEIQVSNGTVHLGGGAGWTVAVSGDNITLCSIQGQHLKDSGSSTNLAGSDSAFEWVVTDNGDGTFQVTSSARNDRALAYQSSGVRFGAYSTTNLASDAYSFKLVFFKAM